MVAEFKNIFSTQVRSGTGKLIDWPEYLPKHEFLEFLVKHKDVCLHGSNNKHLTVLEPKKASSPVAGQAETAVYATTDTLMALFFSILDRPKVPFFATRSDPPFFFVAREALSLKPWTDGMMYIFNRSAFESTAGGHPVSYHAVSPIAKLQLVYTDFPLFDRVFPIDSLEEIDSKFERLKKEF